MPTWFCPAVVDVLDCSAVESEELAWAMAYGQDLTRDNIEKTEVYRLHRALIRRAGTVGTGWSGTPASASPGDRRS